MKKKILCKKKESYDAKKKMSLKNVLEIIRLHAEVYSDTQRDQVAEKLFGIATEDEAHLLASRSMETVRSLAYVDALAEQEAKQQRNALPSDNSESNGSKDSNSLGQDALRFERVECKLAPAVPLSALSKLMSTAPRPAKKIQVTIHLSYGKPLKLTVPENAVVVGIVQEAIKQYGAEYRHPPLKANPHAYELMLAERDGSIDDTFPPFNADTKISQFGTDFCLVEKKIDASSSSVAAPAVAASTASSSSAAAVKSTATSDGGGGGGSTADEENDDDVTTPRRKKLFKVVLPDEQKTLLPYQADMKLSQIMLSVCRKRGLTPSDHFFTEPDDNLQLSETRTVGEIGIDEVFLRSRSAIASTVDQTKLALQTFSVTRHAHSVRRFQNESLTLSVDKDRFYIEKKKKGSKKTNRLITEIVQAVVGEKAGQFTIHYIDGKDITLVASSNEVAAEICSKIEYILKHRY
jgi:SAPK-interacting protein 1 (Sin1), middle CRIM domain/Raf-like Ras-binding domain